jgi:hypothetical protein
MVKEWWGWCCGNLGFGGVVVWQISSLMPCSFVISGLAKVQRAGRAIFRPGSLFGPTPHFNSFERNLEVSGIIGIECSNKMFQMAHAEISILFHERPTQS